MSIYVNVGPDVGEAANRLLAPLDLPRELREHQSTWIDLLSNDERSCAALVLLAAHPDAGGPMIFESAHPFSAEVASYGLLPQMGPLLASAQRLTPHLVIRHEQHELVVTTQGTRPAEPAFSETASIPWTGEMAVALEQLVGIQSATDAELLVFVGAAADFDGLVAAVEAAIPVAKVLTIAAGTTAAEAKVLNVLLASHDVEESERLMDQVDVGLDTGSAVEGLDATLFSLTHERVWVLLVREDVEDVRLAYQRVADDGLDLTTEPGPDTTTRGRAIDVAIAAALRSGGSVRMMDSRVRLPADGFAAILEPLDQRTPSPR